MCRVSIPERNIGQESRDTLDAQMDAAPRQFELDSIYQPLRALLGNRTLENTLFGSGGYQGPAGASLGYYGGQLPAPVAMADTNRAGGALRSPATMPAAIGPGAIAPVTNPIFGGGNAPAIGPGSGNTGSGNTGNPGGRPIRLNSTGGTGIGNTGPGSQAGYLGPMRQSLTADNPTYTGPGAVQPEDDPVIDFNGYLNGTGGSTLKTKTGDTTAGNGAGGISASSVFLTGGDGRNDSSPDTNLPDGYGGLPRTGTIITQGSLAKGSATVPEYRWNGTGWDERLGGQSTGNVLDNLPQGYTDEGLFDGLNTDPTAPGGSAEGLSDQAGLLDMFEHGVTPALTRMQTSASRDLRNATMDDVTRLTPELRANFDAANPESAAMRTQLNELATGGLTSGLTDYETRTAQQASRAAQSARGFGYGANDSFDEAMGLALDTQQRREANRQFALQVEGANNASAIDPWSAITGQSSLGAGAAAAGGFFRPPAGTMFDPFNAYAGDVFSSNQNAAAAEAQANNITGNFLGNL